MSLSCRSLFVLVSATGAACSCSAGVTDKAASPPAAAVAADAPFVVAAPWKATSARLSVLTYGFFSGSMKYAKDRVDMTAAQLLALDGLRTKPDSANRGDADEQVSIVEILDADGSNAKYVASEQDLSGLLGGATATIAQSTLGPFLATLTCTKAKETSERCASAAGAPPPEGCTTKVGADPGCLDGVFVGSDCEDVWMALDVASAGSYEIATVDCIESVTIKLLSADGATLLVESAAGTQPTCSAVTHTFDVPGTFKLLLEKRNAAGCAGGALGGAGDFYLRVAPKR